MTWLNATRGTYLNMYLYLNKTADDARRVSSLSLFNDDKNKVNYFISVYQYSSEPS